MKRMKKKLLALSMTAICISAVAAGTLAYYTSEITVDQNKITSGKIEIDVVDGEGTHVTPPDTLNGIMPGKTVNYDSVIVENTGTSPAWIRVQASTEIIADNLAAKTLLPSIAPDGKFVVTYKLDQNWIDGNDGYYYYKYPVDPKEQTSMMIDEITINSSIGNDYKGCTISINVSAQAVQSKNNLPDDGAKELNEGNFKTVRGWPASSRPEVLTDNTAKEE